MFPTLWSTIKHVYDKDAEKGIKHWGERHKLWYGSKLSKFSKQNVYSTKEILGVNSVSVKKLHRYGHLEEIVVKRSDQQLYKFKEGDFVDQHLNEIEDMLLLAVQCKLFNLDGSVIVDFIVALRMFTRSLILKRRVEDLQLGVVRIRYSFPRSNQNRRDLPRDIPLLSVEVHRYDVKRSKSENKGIVPTEMELVLEQTQQDRRHGPSEAMHNPSQPLKVSQKTLASFLAEIKHISIDFLTQS
ncbi:hypothetical protein Tco_0962725 [Tanacetum coccineum]